MTVNVLHFAAQRLDPITGGYQLGNGYRCYHPPLMRFAAPDSDSPYDIGGVNPYAYCLDDPINEVDPSGHFGVGLFGDMGFFDQGLSRLFSSRKSASIAEEAAISASETKIQGVAKLSSRDDRYAMLDAHLSGRAKMSPISNGGYPQAEATPGAMFGLRNDKRFPLKKNRYRLYDLESGRNVDQLPHGRYNFVIREDEPQVVRVGHIHAIEGHTSMAHGVMGWFRREVRGESLSAVMKGPVKAYYAGEVRFWEGRLDAWNAESGHYLPPMTRKAAKHAFTPWVRRILPLKRRTVSPLDEF